MRSVLAAAIVLGGVGISVAQDTGTVPDFVGSGWQVQCANSGTDLDCAAVQQISRADTGFSVAALTIRLPVETGIPVIMVQVPLGISVTAPVTLQVDAGPTESFSLQTCTVAGCFAGLQAPKSLIEGMRAGANLTLGFQDVDGQAIRMTVSLAGFSLAYGKLQ